MTTVAAAGALHRANLGRAQQLGGDPETALGTLEQSATRDFYGPGDLLTDYLTAALDDDRPALERVLGAARTAGDHEVARLTADALKGRFP